MMKNPKKVNKKNISKILSKLPQLPIKDNNPPPENIALTTEFLNSLVDRYKNAANDDLIDYKTNLEALRVIISEYLNDFIVIGHNVLGQRVFFRYCKNAKEDDALTELFKKCFVKTMNEEGTVI
jgi:hypothetical protein